MEIPSGKEWSVYFEYADGYSCTYYGTTEDECMCSGIECKEHGEVTYYTVVNNETYVDGHYCPEEERIYK